MSGLSGKRIVVLGAGGSGVAAARLAHGEGGHVCLVDSGVGASLDSRARDLRGEGIECRFGWRAGGAEAWDLCVFSPGVPMDSPMGRHFRAASAACESELAFGSRYCDCPKVAVTGTNGKTTVVEMLTHCLRSAGRDAVACGNIGLPLSAVALSGRIPSCAVVEVSSYQLESTGRFETEGAALLNVTPDHLSRHGSMEAYRDTKLRLLGQVRPGGRCVVRSSLLGEPRVRCLREGHQLVSFGLGASDQEDFSLCDGWLVRRGSAGARSALISVSSLPYGGAHNYENCLAVLALGEALGCPAAELAPHLASFSIGRHRMEVVGECSGIRYVNDSKATNVDALIQSLRCFGGAECDIALIAGGVTKGCDLSLALPEMRGRVKTAYLIGESRGELKAKWGDEIACVECGSLEEAVVGASGCVSGGGTVLLSPGCASQDMFRDYEDRGDAFVELVVKLRALNEKHKER